MQISGRTVTNRGVHLLPFGYHEAWLDPGGWFGADWWGDLLVSMHLSWVVVCAEGGSVTDPQALLDGRSVVQFFLGRGIIPVVRFQLKLNYPFSHMAHVEELVRQFAPYGLRPRVLLGNEPGDPREWENGQVPADWFERYCAWFQRHSADVVRAGAIAGFADGPCYDRDPFPLMEGTWDNWLGKLLFWAYHGYGLNRDKDHPYNTIVQTGLPLIDEQYLIDWFGPFYNDPGFNDLSVAVINASREAGVQPGLTAIEDATCYRGYERILAWMVANFGQPLDIALTEGGWTPAAFCDFRYPRPTPQQVALWTLEAFEEPGNPLLFQCPWILGDQMMGGAGSWNRESWVNPIWRNIYPDDIMPVVRILQANPPGGLPTARRCVADALAKLAAAAALLD